jgi:hypothetical protein
MTRKSTIILGAMSIFTFGFAQSTDHAGESNDVSVLRSIDHGAFKEGEKLTYVVHYGWLNAGEAVVELKGTDRDVSGRPLIHAVGTGRSLGAFNAFYKVNDLYETYMDKEGVFPYYFKRRVNEGGYTINHDYIFKQQVQQVKTQDDKFYDVPAHTQDMLSAFYYARTIDFSKAKKGDVFTIDTFLDNELFPLRMKYLGKETIKIRGGKYRCLKFLPVVQEGRIFKDEDDLNVWITDDSNRIPVLVRAKVLVGSIKMELTDYEGLANPIAKLD